MFHPIHDDPDVKLDKHLRNECFKSLGRHCTEEEYQEWQRKYYKRLEEASKESRKRQEEARKEEEAKLKQREKLLTDRINSRHVIPESYSPTVDVDTLFQCSGNNIAYAERTSINGDEKRAIEIDFDLELFNLSNSHFNNVIFKNGCNLSRASFKGARLNNVTFEGGVQLSEAEFDDAELSNVKFSPDANIKGASFRFAKFRRGVSVEFDRNYIANATFDSSRNDIWAKLSLSYAGIWQFLNITLSGLYFGVILLKLYGFKALTSVQSKLLSYDSNGYLNSFETVEISAFRFVFGEQLLSIVIAMLILSYQGLRLFVTTNIAPLIENEKRSGYTPDRSSYMAYSTLNYFIRILGIAVVALFSYEVWEMFQKDLVIPLPGATGVLST